MHILKSELKCGDKIYRATVKRGKFGAILTVEQPFNDGEFSPCSSWYIETLMQGKTVSDSIAIDYGQNWNIDSGMIEAVYEALRFLTTGYKTEGNENV